MRQTITPPCPQHATELLSHPAATVTTVTTPALPDLVDTCDALGLMIRWTPMPPHRRGAYDARRRIVYLARDLDGAAAVATLMHEMEHARRGDDGHQPRAVERRIDETVAHQLITADDYARAEAVTGARDSGAIAVEMGLPRWVVSAYRRTLRRAR